MNPDAGSPSSSCAFRLSTLAVELTVNGATPALTVNAPAGPPAEFLADSPAAAAPPDFANTPTPDALVALNPVPDELLANVPVGVLLALFTPNANAPTAAFVFVTCSCSCGEAPASVVLAFTEFDTPRLNTPQHRSRPAPPSLPRRPARRQPPGQHPSETTHASHPPSRRRDGLPRPE